MMLVPACSPLTAERVEQLERALGDHADRHSRELQARHDHLERRLQSCEKTAASSAPPMEHPEHKAKVKELDRHHSTLKERVDYLENAIGDNLDRHVRDLDSLRGAHTKLHNEAKARDALHSSLAERMEYVEKLLGDSDAKHQQELKAAHSKLEQLHGRLQTCEEHGSAVEGLRRAQGTLAAREAHHTSLAERLDWLERLLGGSVDRQPQVLSSRQRPLLERLDLVEKTLGTAEPDRWGQARDAQQQPASLLERLVQLERQLGETHEKHSSELKAAHGRLEQLHGRMSACEGMGGDLAAAHARVDQLHGAIKEERAAREAHHSSVDGLLSKDRERGHLHSSLEERLHLLESVLPEHAEKIEQLREKLGAEAQLRAQHHDAVSEQLQREQRAREAHEQAVQGHLGGEKKAREGHERLVQEMFGHEKTARERHLTHVQEQLGREREARDKHHEVHQEQLGRHRATTEAAHKELFDIIHREKASREQLHSSHQELLNQERGERQRHHDAANERVDSLQRTVGIFDSLIRKEMEERARENRRIWDAIDNHTHDLSTQVITERGSRKDLTEAVSDGSPLPSRLARSASASNQVFTLPSPVGTVHLQPGPAAEPVRRALTPEVVRLPAAAVRAPSPVPSPPYGGAVATAPVLQQVVTAGHPLAPTVRTVTQIPEPGERRLDRIERINCGHTRYHGERQQAAEVLMD